MKDEQTTNPTTDARAGETMTQAERKAAFLEVYDRNACNVSRCCKAVGIDRWTYYDWCKADPEFKRSIDAAREALIDTAESLLAKQMAEGNVTALVFFLKCQGKSRGYVERTEHDLQMVQAVHLPDGTPLPASFAAAVDRARQN